MTAPWIAALSLLLATLGGAPAAHALSSDRWTNGEPYGIFFNDYDPNFYTGFAPRVQERARVQIHLARGNQLRVRLVLSDATIDHYLTDQVARHDLYKEMIDKGVIVLTTNTAWEEYDERFQQERIRELAAQKASLPPAEWRALNLKTMEKLNPDRLYHIRKDFGALVTDWAARLKASPAPTTLAAKLQLVNDFFPRRIFAHRLTPAQETTFDALVTLAKADDLAGFRPQAATFFRDVTGGIYDVRDGTIDYWEYTAIWAAGTYDKTTQHAGRTIPAITTPGVWTFIPREHGKGMTGMVDYISSAGYYGLLPMLPYEHGGGDYYNSIHNTGISNWIAGHSLLPKEWRTYAARSRNGKPYNRVAMTSRGPVSHGCTRLNTGHLAELREMLPSTSDGLRGIVNFRNVSHCYDVFDRKGDGTLEIMGVQYYIAFRHTKSRVANQIWVQNNRKDFYDWLYGDEMTFGPIGSVTFAEVCEGAFVNGKAVEGRTHAGLPLYEAPYVPDAIQFYRVKGVDSLSDAAMELNREMRRVGHGYTLDRAVLRLP